MYAVTKTYKDFNGVERTETKLFNLTETEVMEMELGTAGGVAEMLQRRCKRSADHYQVL